MNINASPENSGADLSTAAGAAATTAGAAVRPATTTPRMDSASIAASTFCNHLLSVVPTTLSVVISITASAA